MDSGHTGDRGTLLRKPANPSPGTARRLIPRFAAVLSAIFATLFFAGQAAAATPVAAAVASVTTLADRTLDSAAHVQPATAPVTRLVQAAAPVTALAQTAAPVTSAVQRVSAQATDTLADATPASLATHAEGAVGSVLSSASGVVEAAGTGASTLHRVISTGAGTIASEGSRVVTGLRAAKDPETETPAAGTVAATHPSIAQPKPVETHAASSAPTAGASAAAPAVTPATSAASSAATDRASRLPILAASCGSAGNGSCASARTATARIAALPRLALSSAGIASALNRQLGATALSGHARGSRTAPARPRPGPVPTPGGASPVAGAGSGFSPTLLLALACLLLLCWPGVMRRWARTAERWRLAPLALISARPG
jgi:hypothetical protein